MQGHPDIILCPADGTIVAIEEVEETEFFHDRRIQVSVFMSPNNVHVNLYPISGKIIYTNYWPGSFLVAWHPKSSTENERNTVVIENSKHGSVLVRQIAGALARRIVCYAKTNERINQGYELGFIKFGSRVDLFLPLTATINVKLEDKVKGGITTIARF
jgi:phosphatidylserine decarboxylase